MYATKLHLSATAPDMIVAAVAANTYWKNHVPAWPSGIPAPTKYSLP